MQRADKTFQTSRSCRFATPAKHENAPLRFPHPVPRYRVFSGAGHSLNSTVIVSLGMISHMKRTTLVLDERQFAELKKLATTERRTGRPRALFHRALSASGRYFYQIS